MYIVYCHHKYHLSPSKSFCLVVVYTKNIYSKLKCLGQQGDVYSKNKPNVKQMAVLDNLFYIGVNKITY